MKKILALILILSLAIITVGCGNDSEKAVKTDEEKTNGTEKTEGKEEVTVILNNEDKTKEDKWDELPEGADLVLLDVTITNNTDKEYEFMPDYFSLEVDGSRLNVTDIAPKTGELLHTTMIKPDESITGLINFKVDEGKEYKIIYDDFNKRIELE